MPQLAVLSARLASFLLADTSSFHSALRLSFDPSSELLEGSIG